MASDVENIVDLGLVNYVQHPSDPNYIVFRFADKNRADAFAKELEGKNIWFERDEQEARTKTYYLFGIRKRDYAAVQSINFAVEGKHRSFLMPNAYFRWAVLLICFGVILLAIVGYCTRPDLLMPPVEIK